MQGNGIDAFANPRAVLPPGPDRPYNGSYASLPAVTLKPPSEGNRTVPVKILWSKDGTAPSYTIHFNARAQQVTSLSQIAALHVDNTQCASTINIVFPDTEFQLQLGPNSEGFYPVVTNGLEFYAYIDKVPGANDRSVIQVLNFMPPPIEFGSGSGGGVGTVREVDTVAPIQGGPITDQGSISLSVPLTINFGGTGAITAPLALDALSGASGAMAGNLSRSAGGIWAVSAALAMPLAVASGGTGQTTLAPNRVLVGNGTGPVTASPVLQEDGTTLSVTGTGGAIITSNAAALPPVPITTQLRVAGADGAYTALTLDAFGVNAPYLIMRSANGTNLARAPVSANQALGGIQGYGANGSANYSFGSSIGFFARENWTPTATGSHIVFQTTAIGTTTIEAPVAIGRGVVVGGPIANDPGRVGTLLVTQNAGLLPAPTAPAILRVAGADADDCHLQLDSFGLGHPEYRARAARGTATALLALQANDYTMGIIAEGANGPGGYGYGGAILNLARENWSASAVGSGWQFQTVAPTTTTIETPVSIGRGLIVGATFSNDPGPGSIYASGNITIGGTATKPGGGSWVAPSDRALKSATENWNTGLAAVLALKPQTYRYTDDAWNMAELDYIGLDAAEAAKVIPEMGRTVPIPGDDPEDEPQQFAAVDSGPLIYALVNAVQTLAKRLDQLEKGRK